jgi:hypothetical protein
LLERCNDITLGDDFDIGFVVANLIITIEEVLEVFG